MSEQAAQVVPQAPQAPVEGVTTQTAQPLETKPDPRLAQLAARERRLRAMDKEIKDREMAIRIKEQMEYIPKSELDKYVPKSKLQENTFQTLSELGIPYDKVTQEALENSDPVLQRITAAEQRAAAAEARAEELEKKYVDGQTQSIEQAKAQMKREARKLVETDERYEVIRHEGMSDIIVDVIEQDFYETGGVNGLLDYEQVADVLENKLAQKNAERAKLKKVQSLLTPTQQAAQAELPTPKYKRDDGMRATITPRDMKATTLTNQMPSTTKPLSARERAILAGKGLLK